MFKVIINNDKHLINTLFSIGLEINLIESEFGIEFAFENGKFQDEDGVDEEQSISDSIYRIIVEGLMPEKYPCLLVIHYEKNFDRNNNYEILFFEFVYESDLKK